MLTQFDAWMGKNPDGAGSWNPKLTMGAMKPKNSSFVEVGIATLKTPEMTAAIQNAFARDGRFELMRGVEWQEKARIKSDEIVVVVDEGEESEKEDAFDDSDSDNSSHTFVELHRRKELPLVLKI